MVSEEKDYEFGGEEIEKGYEFLVDTREKPAFTKKVDEIVGKRDVKWRRTTLDADLVLRRVRPIPVEDVVGIERKAIADLVGSVQSGRIFKQIDRMKSLFPIRYLVISGSVHEYMAKMRFRKFHINMAPVYGALASFTVKERVNILWFPDDNTLIDVMYRICTKISEGKYDSKREMGGKWEGFTPVNALVLVPGVTSSRSAALLNHFGSIRGLCLATEEELMEIDGIGRKTAGDLHSFLGRVK